MKPAYILALSLLSAALVHPARAQERPTRTEAKGIELYSWQDANGGWVFALLPGTNRLKAEAEVKQKENQIAGADELEKHFLRLAEREQVFWSHQAEGFVYPDEATREEIAASARKAKVELHGREDRKPGGAPEASCYELVQDRIAWDYDGNRRWAQENVERLCAGSSRPREPGRCFHHVMHGGVEWGRGTRWEWEHALALCAGTEDARKTVHCFSAKVREGTSWDQAVAACKTPPRSTPRGPAAGEG